MSHRPVKKGIHGVRVGHIGGNHQRPGGITGLRGCCGTRHAFQLGGTAVFPI